MGKKLEFIKVVTVFVALPILFFSVIHEQRHKTIAESFGCEAEISYLPYFGKDAFMYTKIGTDCLSELTKKEIVAMRTMQTNVETTGYQLLPILMMNITLVLFYYLKNNKSGKSHEKIRRVKLS